MLDRASVADASGVGIDGDGFEAEGGDEVGGVVEGKGESSDFASAGGDGFTDFFGEEFGEFFGPFSYDIGDVAEKRLALVAGAELPGLEGFVGGVEAGFELAPATLGGGADDLAVVGGSDDFLSHGLVAGSSDEEAVDEHLCVHVG